MVKGSFKLSEQISNYGFFGLIELNCIVTENPKNLNVVIPDQFKRWEPGIMFGAKYFMEHLLEQVGIIVEITKVEFHEVDTNNTILAYITFNAMLSATNLQLKNLLLFDKEKKSFVFPK
jgi:hypothetical protein